MAFIQRIQDLPNRCGLWKFHCTFKSNVAFENSGKFHCTFKSNWCFEDGQKSMELWGSTSWDYLKNDILLKSLPKGCTTKLISRIIKQCERICHFLTLYCFQCELKKLEIQSHLKKIRHIKKFSRNFGNYSHCKYFPPNWFTV